MPTFVVARLVVTKICGHIISPVLLLAGHSYHTQLNFCDIFARFFTGITFSSRSTSHCSSFQLLSGVIRSMCLLKTLTLEQEKIHQQKLRGFTFCSSSSKHAKCFLAVSSVSLPKWKSHFYKHKWLYSSVKIFELATRSCKLSSADTLTYYSRPCIVFKLISVNVKDLGKRNHNVQRQCQRQTRAPIVNKKQVMLTG